jgi:hypothetical protein
MSRLGERLLAAGLLTHEQLEQALRAQVVWGGRLGTNLVELNCLELDALATALGKQRALPPAHSKHFDRADPALQQALAPELAARYSVIPLLRFGTPAKIAVVSIDPLSHDARAEIADAFGLQADQIVPSIAAEMRVRYHLERIYGIRRAARFLRSRGKTVPPFPIFDPNAMPFDVEEPTSPTITAESTPQVSLPAQADDLAAMIDAAIDNVTTPAEPAGRERRTYVKTIVDEEPAPADPQKGSDSQALGRIEIRRVAVPPTPAPAPSRPTKPTKPKPTKVATSLTDATRAIRRAADRDRAADLIIDTLQRFAPVCTAAMLLVIRGEAAIAWKHFCRDDEGSLPEVAVPMDKAGLCVTAVECDLTTRAVAADLGPIDLRLLRALGRQDGDLVVVPIPIAGKVICLLAVATAENAQLAPVEAVASAAAAAFARLIRDASR